MPEISKHKVSHYAKEILLDVIGSLFLAIGLNVFSVPNQIVAGGVTGIATLINHFTGVPIGTMALFINMPLLAIGYRYIGKKFFMDTVRVLVISAVCIDYITIGLPVYTGNLILASIYGGVCIGIGLGVIIMRGSSTGGSDIVIRIITRQYPHMSFGTIMMAFDFLVVTAAGIIYHDLESVLYALLLIYISGEIINRIIRGLDLRKMVFMVSNKAPQISDAIIRDLSRGATVIDAKGAYSGAATNMVICAVSNHEFPKLKRLLREIDPTAFIMVTEAGEILGEGFKSIHSED